MMTLRLRRGIVFGDETLEAALRVLMRSGALVPIEPDYEAAMNRAKTFIGWLHTRMVLHPNTYDEFVRESIRSIVDAAFGIVEETT